MAGERWLDDARTAGASLGASGSSASALRFGRAKEKQNYIRVPD
jgi:hypothetical protein